MRHKPEQWIAIDILSLPSQTKVAAGGARLASKLHDQIFSLSVTGMPL